MIKSCTLVGNYQGRIQTEGSILCLVYVVIIQWVWQEYEKKGLSSGAFKNYMDKILDFFDPQPSPLVDSFT